MKIKKKYQNPKIEKRQKEEKKEVLEYKNSPLYACSTACVPLISMSSDDFIQLRKILDERVKVD